MHDLAWEIGNKCDILGRIVQFIYAEIILPIRYKWILHSWYWRAILSKIRK